MAHALHQAAVARDHPGVVRDRPNAEALPLEALGERHSDSVGEALAEWAGGDFDPGCVACLRVARGQRTE